MNISDLIKILQAARKEYGNVPVKLIDSMSGEYIPVAQVYKLHPFTAAPYNTLNRAEPVNAIAISEHRHNSPDLVLGE